MRKIKVMKLPVTLIILILGGLIVTSCVKDIEEAFEKAIDKALEPLTEAQKQAHRDALTDWINNNATDQEAIKEFGYDNCFKVTELREGVYSKELLNNPALQASDLREVRSLHLWQEPGNARNTGILVGIVLANKDIAQDLCNIFKQLYEAKYPVNRMETCVFDYTENDIKKDNMTFCYSYYPNQSEAVSEQNQKGLAICLNPGNAPQNNDKAVKIFKEHGFKWDGKYTFTK